MTAERVEFEEWVDNPSVLTHNECPSKEPEVVSAWEANPYADPWTAAAWEGWKARGRLEDEEDRAEAKRRRSKKRRTEAQEPLQQDSEPISAPLESTTAVEPSESPVEAQEDNDGGSL